MQLLFLFICHNSGFFSITVSSIWFFFCLFLFFIRIRNSAEDCVFALKVLSETYFSYSFLFWFSFHWNTFPEHKSLVLYFLLACLLSFDEFCLWEMSCKALSLTIVSIIGAEQFYSFWGASCDVSEFKVNWLNGSVSVSMSVHASCTVLLLTTVTTVVNLGALKLDSFWRASSSTAVVGAADWLVGVSGMALFRFVVFIL